MLQVTHLIGFGGAALPVSAMTFQTSSSGTSQTITCPTVGANDVIVLFDQGVNTSGAPSNAVPSGFTQLQTSAGSFTRVTLSYKLAVGNEAGSSLSGMTGDLSIAKVILVFRPTGVISSVVTSTFLEQTTDSNPGAQLIAASGQPAPLIRIGSAALGSTSFAPNFSVGTFDATVAQDGSSFGGIRAGYAIQNSAPSDDSPDLADNGAGNCLITGYLRFS
jgi:hypothetical protein